MVADSDHRLIRLFHACLAGFLAMHLWGNEAPSEDVSPEPAWPIDTIYLNDGSEIRGTVLRIQGQDAIVDIGMATVTINVHRIQAIAKGKYQRTTEDALLSPAVAASSRTSLRVDTGCSGGWYLGELRGSGVISKGPLSADFSETASLTGLRLSPGAFLRTTASPRAPDPAPVFGLQIGYEPALGTSETGSAVAYSAVGGITWMSGRLRCDLLAIAGWTTASLKNTSIITGTGNVVLGQADYNVDLAGWNAALELSSAWSRGPWSLGIGAGLASSQLAGDAAWTSSNGIYTANEHFSVFLVGAYASLHAGVTW